MYTLYYAPGACSLSVHIVLEWTGAPYAAIKVDPSAPEYDRINPAGAVPAFDIGLDRPLTQCAAILRFLARRYPEAALDDDGTLERSAELERWSSFITGDLHPAFFPIFKPERYTTDHSERSLANVRAAGTDLVRRKLRLMDRHLEGREHFLGRKRTIIDAYSVPMVRWASSILHDSFDDFPDVKRHHNGMLADVSVRKAMEEEGTPVVVVPSTSRSV